MLAAPAGADPDDIGPPLVWEAFTWGLLSAVSLNIGSTIGVTCLPGRRARAVMMSFGGGALLFALSIELFGNVLQRSEEEQSTALVWVMEGAAIVGGIFFASLNHLLNVAGAYARKPSTRTARLVHLRTALLRRLTLRLQRIPFFSALSPAEVRDLIQSAMYKERFNEGDVIMSNATRDGGIFFILSGQVRLQIHDIDLPLPLAAPDGEQQAQPGTGNPLAGLNTSWDLGPHQVFGDMTVLTGTDIRTTAVSLETTKLLVIPGHEVTHVLEASPAVREWVSLRAVEQLRHIRALWHLPDQALAALAQTCSLVRYQPGDSVFRGAVDEETPLVCLVFGALEVSSAGDTRRRVIRASRLMCTEHLLSGKPSKPFFARAVEPTSVLFISRRDLSAIVARWPRSRSSAGSVERNNATVARAAGQRVAPQPQPESTHKEGRGEAGAFHSAPAGLPPGQVAHKAPAPVFGAFPTLDLVHPRTPADAAGCCCREDSGAAPGAAPGEPYESSTAGPPTDESRRSLQSMKNWGSLRSISGTSFSSVASGATSVKSCCDSRHSQVQAARTLSMAPFLGDGLTRLGHSLGWDDQPSQCDEDDLPPMKLPNFGRSQSILPLGHVTDQELESQELERANRAFAVSKEAVRPSSKGSCSTSEQSSDDTKDEGVQGQNGGRHRAVMIWLGILIDAIPESLVIGILVNRTAVAGDDAYTRFSRTTGAVLPFVIGVFLSNLPESMSSSGSMKSHGMRVSTILMMWFITTLLTAAGASMGAVIFPPRLGMDDSTELAVASVEGLAAGAMLTMIAQTMMPEAFEQGGDIVGLSCLAGFLCALSVKLVPADDW